MSWQDYAHFSKLGRMGIDRPGKHAAALAEAAATAAAAKSAEAQAAHAGLVVNLKGSNPNLLNGDVVNSESSDTGTGQLEPTLDVKHHCMRISKEQVRVVLSISPLEPPLRTLFTKRDPLPRIPIRLACILDVSHSMSEVYGPDPEGPTKLDRIKIFAKLLIRSLGSEDQLALVTYATTGQVILPLQRMTEEAQKEAVTAIDSLSVRGVTNMSAGIFEAIQQFSVNFSKSRFVNFNDNILLFSDGMANEGIVDTTELIAEIKRRIAALKEESHFESDYTIKFATLGTGGFLGEQLYSLGQTFSSDPFYFIHEDSNLELDLMTPVALRQSGSVANLRVSVEALNGATIDRSESRLTEYLTVPDEYDARKSEKEIHRAIEEAIEKKGGKSNSVPKPPNLPPLDKRMECYVISDIATNATRNIMLTIKLPKNYKKVLKDKNLLRIDVRYKDSLMSARTVEKKIAYSEVPAKEKMNVEEDVVAVALQECRHRTVVALEKVSDLVAKLDRARAKSVIQSAAEDLHTYAAHISTEHFTCEESQAELDSWTDRLGSNLIHCEKFVEDFSVRWDDAWGRLKALQSSISREVPSTMGVYVDRAKMFEIEKVSEKMYDLCDSLMYTYSDLGLDISSLDRYKRPPAPPKQKQDSWEDGDGEGDDGYSADISSFNLAALELKQFSETTI